MKHRGIKIYKVKYVLGIDIGKRENSPVKNIYGIGYNYSTGKYPMELEECKTAIDNMILQVMKTCAVNEPEAIKLINNIS